MDKLIDIDKLHAKHARQQKIYIVSGLLILFFFVFPVAYFSINKKLSKHIDTSNSSTSSNQISENSATKDTDSNTNNMGDNSAKYQSNSNNVYASKAKTNGSYNEYSYDYGKYSNSSTSSNTSTLSSYSPSTSYNYTPNKPSGSCTQMYELTMQVVREQNVYSQLQQAAAGGAGGYGLSASQAANYYSSQLREQFNKLNTAQQNLANYKSQNGC